MDKKLQDHRTKLFTFNKFGSEAEFKGVPERPKLEARRE